MLHDEHRTDWIKSFYESAVEWWGESWYEGENLKGRYELIKKYSKSNTVLELAAGTGETVAYLCEKGYSICAVDICKSNIKLLNQLKAKYPNLDVVEGNFLDVAIGRKFNTICIFEAFGLGSDTDQRSLLKRISNEWLDDDGILIMDVYHPYLPIRSAGTKIELDKLDNVPGSVDMTDYTYYDPVKGRWVDLWEPKNQKEKSRAQSIRCYTPADFMLLIENTGFIIEKMEFRGKEFNHQPDEVDITNIFDNNDRWYSYVVIMRKKNMS